MGTVCLCDVASVVEALRPLIDMEPGDHLLDDQILDQADEVELIDVSPEELQERLRGGEILPMSRVATALAGIYRTDILRTLREMAFRRVTALSDRHLLAYMDQASIASTWEARPRVLVCVSPHPGAESVLEGAARLAASRGDALTVLSIRGKSHDDDEKRLLGEYAALTHRLGGEFVSIYSLDVPTAIAEYAHTHRITEVIVRRGHERKSRTLRKLIQVMWDLDFHILATSGG